MSEHPLLPIAEGDIAELYLMLEGSDMLGMSRFLDGVLCQQDLIDTLHRGKSLRDIISYLGDILQGVDDAVEDNHIIDKGGT